MVTPAFSLSHMAGKLCYKSFYGKRYDEKRLQTPEGFRAQQGAIFS
jgi:hypothetical protein